MKFRTTLHVQGLGEVPHVQYQGALMEVMETIRERLGIEDHREDPRSGDIDFTVTVENDEDVNDLWDVREPLNAVEESIESLGYGTTYDKPEVIE